MAGRARNKLVVQTITVGGVEPETEMEPLLRDGSPEELKQRLWLVLRASTEEHSIDVECDKCPGYKHRVLVRIPGGVNAINAAKELLDRMQGKAAAQKTPEPLPKFDISRISQLTDEQLAAIIAAGPGGVSTDG